MNTISLCRPVPELPEAISFDLIIVQMLILEQYLTSTNPILEEDLYMGLMEKLAGIYTLVNRFPNNSRRVYFSAVRPPFDEYDTDRKSGIRVIQIEPILNKKP